MKPFVCWNAGAVHETIVDDAPRGAPAVFAAVHRPMRILRKTIRTRHGEEGTAVSEQDVLADLFSSGEEDRFIPITGDSGTGKSHLIRWLDDHKPDDPRFHVVYISKRGTSLRKVIDTILDGMDDSGAPNAERFAELRRQVAEAASGLDRETAPLRLLNEVGMALRERGVEASAGSDEGELDDREDLSERLPDLLFDPAFRDVLLAPKGVVATTVRQALEGSRSATEDGEAPEFSLDDLDLSAADATAAARTAQTLRADLYADPKLKELAVRMMNEALPTAVKGMLNLKSEDLFEVLMQVRQALHDAGKILVLLVEDLALLRGVENELVEAMIITPDERGKRDLCVIRSAVAVTTGYFDSLRTALTRMDHRGPLYNLDARIGSDGVSDEEVRAFVATYLNAARWGREKLEEKFEAAPADARADGRWLDSYCTTCPFVDDCLPAFGKEEGYGLYPFNAPALKRVVESQMQAFDPRHLLTILSRTLRDEARPLEEGEFPRREWADLYDAQRVAGAPELRYIPPDVEDDLQRRDPDADRRMTLLTFWGGVPQHLVDLPEPIHDAFAIPQLGGIEVLDPAAIQGDEDVTPPAPVGRRPPVERAPAAPPTDEDPLTLWANGRKLNQTLATQLRKDLRALTRGARDWNTLGVEAAEVDEVLVPEAFYLDNAAGGGRPREPIAVLKPTAGNAVLLQALRDAHDARDWSQGRAPERFAEILELVDGWAEEALRRIRSAQRGDGTTDPEIALTQALLISAALLGAADPRASDAALVDATLAPTPMVNGTTSWDSVCRKVATSPSSSAASRENLRARLSDAVALHRAEDAEAVIAVDPVPLLRGIDQLRDTDFAPPDSDGLRAMHRSFGAYAQGLQRLVDDDLSERISALGAERARALELLGSDGSAASIAKKLEVADQVARDAQVGARRAAVKRNEIISSFRQVDLKTLTALQALDQPEMLPVAEQLRLAGGPEARSLATIGAFLDWSEQMLGEVTDNLGQHTNSDGGAPDGLDGVVKELAGVLADLHNLLGGESDE
jgi:hypothetical protein